MKECMYYLLSSTKESATQNKTHVPSSVLLSCTYSYYSVLSFLPLVSIAGAISPHAALGIVTTTTFCNLDVKLLIA